MLKEQVNYYGALDIIKDDIFTKDFRRVYKKFKKRIPKKVSFSPKSWEEEDSKY